MSDFCILFCVLFDIELTEVNLRVYIGEEYECPRGHRFFCSGPEKIIKVSSTSTVKVCINNNNVIMLIYHIKHSARV